VLTDMAKRASLGYADTAAYTTQYGWSISYRELDTAADEAVAGLAARGIREGSVVASVLPGSTRVFVRGSLIHASIYSPPTTYSSPTCWPTRSIPARRPIG